jgi:hypothetical protein
MTVSAPTTAGQVLTSAYLNNNINSGLTYIKSQTIGSAVASVSVTDAFSATYDNYVIALNEFESSGAQLTLALNGITTLYSYQLNYASYANTPQAIGNTLQSNWQYVIGMTSAQKNSGIIELQSPFVASPTRIRSPYADAGASGQLTAINNNATSATGFTVAPATGTITGGTITVYGYRKA